MRRRSPPSYRNMRSVTVELEAILLGIAISLYTLAIALYLWGVLGGHGAVARAATWSILLGLIVHGVVIGVKVVTQQRLPFINLFEALIFTAWLLMLIYLIIERRSRITALGLLTCLTALVMLLIALALPRGISETLLPALQNRWSGVHILSCLISAASFALAFGAAIGYTVQEYLLKRKRINILQQLLPPLDTVDRLAYEMVTLGFFTLTLGIIAGSLWAQTAWGSYWNWDPKETWSLITWLVYAVYLHMRIIQGWHGKWANRLLIMGFTCVLITFLGISFWGQGLHSYRW